MTPNTVPSPIDIQAALKQYFGFEEFLPGQRRVIELLVAGRSAAAVFPTGGGKSLCYQLPALLVEGLTLVVSPLIALMKDQIDALAARGIEARRLDSTLSFDEYRDVMEQVRSGRLRMLYVAPERFTNERFRAEIRNVKVTLFAVDEAHCISEWGHNFRPDYLKLAGFAKMCSAGCTLALTATATEKVLEDICRGFQIEADGAVRTGFYRPNLTILTTPVDESQRDGALVERLETRAVGSTIVYVTLQRTAEEVAGRLADAGVQARAYHAGMGDQHRADVQDWFLASDRGVVVATIAFGMGIDKPNIRYVYHYNLPKSLENYAQEIGRAGRDGDVAVCELFVCPDDLTVLENFVYGDTPTAESIEAMVRFIFDQGENFDVSIYELSSEHDIRILVVRTLLTYLELQGYLEGGTPFYTTYRFKPLATSAEILSKFNSQRRVFLAGMFRVAKKARTWFHLDVDEAASATGSDRQRVLRALDYLGEKEFLEVRSAGVRHRYRRLKAPGDLPALAKSLRERTVEREEREIERLHQVLELADHDGCQVSMLCAHFAETLEHACGHCTRCLKGTTSQPIPARKPTSIDSSTWSRAQALRDEHTPVLSDERVLARFLCGLTSPALSRAKLTSETLFGTFTHIPFQEVLEYIEANR